MSVVTVSRQYGSAGRDIARAVAELLGAKYVDRELIVEAAHRTGAPVDIVSDRDERIQSVTERLMETVALAFTGLPWTRGYRPSTAESPLTDAEMIAVTRALIKETAKSQNAVIVGRGAHMVLAKERSALHVQVVAPLEERVGRIMGRRGISAEEAERLIAKIDADRAAYLRTFYQADWEDPLHYHLVVNTGILGQEMAVQLIVLAAVGLDEGQDALGRAGGEREATQGLLPWLRTSRAQVRDLLQRYRDRDEP